MNFRYALRRLQKNPGFTLTAVLTLAIGIGAATAIFSLVDAVLLRPLPFPQPDRLLWLSQQDHSLPGTASESLSYPDYFDWRAHNHSFRALASFTGGGVTFLQNGESQRLDAQMVSSNFFQALDVAPIVGRDFRQEDEKPGNRAVMLSYGLWQSAFASSRQIGGSTITLDDKTYTVAGVMPKGFRFPAGGEGAALWLSLADAASGNDPATNQRGNDQLEVIGRLNPGVTLQQAKADLDVIAAGIAHQYPDTDKWYTTVLAQPLLDHMVGNTRPALRLLFAAVILVMLLACANVAGLLMARGSERTAELALRSAIGARRSELIRLLLAEPVILSLCGGIAGVLLASLLLKALIHLAPLDIPRLDQVSLSVPVLWFALAISALTGLFFGLLPAWQTSKAAPSQALREATRSLSSGRRQNRIHSGLVISQTTIGLVLLAGSGLLIRSFLQVLHIDPGFDPKNVFTARVRVPFDRYSHDQHFQLYERLLPKLAAIPGVQSASAGWPLPLSDNHATISFAIDGRPVAPGDRPSESISVVLPGYFETLRIPLFSGRTFTERDGLNGSPVAIINQAFARKYFPGQAAIGKRFQPGLGDDSKFDHSFREIVGVVGDVKGQGLTTGTEPQYYLPLAQALITNTYLTIRTSGDPAAIEPAVRLAMSEISKDMPLYQVQSLAGYVSQSEAAPRFQTVLLTCFAAVALLLSAIGLYGLLAYTVAERSFEIALRMAVGAQRADVLRMILGRGLKLAGIGIIAGFAASASLSRLLTHMLYRIEPLDPVTFTLVGLTLVAVSALASLAPALRASRTDAMKTLHDQ
jgi:predicted permease